MKSVTILFGPNGAGKGTLTDGALVGREEEFTILATGNIIRNEVAKQTPLGKQAQTYMEAGLLVPSDLILNMVLEAIQTSEKPVILDGFPRNTVQALALLDSGIIPTKVIVVNLDDNEIIKRLAGRRICKNCGKTHSTEGPKRPKVNGVCDKCGGELYRRKDDSPDVVRTRLEVYRNETEPALSIMSDHNISIFIVNNNHPDAQDEFTRFLLG